MIISIAVIIGTIFYIYIIPNHYKKTNSSSAIIYNTTINSTTPFPIKLNNSNFSRFISNPINNSNVIINNISYPAYHGYSTYYVNKKYIINVQQEIFANSLVASHQFNTIKNNLNQSLIVQTNFKNNYTTNYNSITNTINFNKTNKNLSKQYNPINNKLIKNLSQNMMGINSTISKFSNSYILYAINENQICSASFTQFTNISFNTPIELLKSTIATCFNS